MKKRLLLGIAALAALSMSAQTSLVKEVERGVKANQPSEELLNKIQPALTDPETAGLAETWVIAGKTGFGFYQDALIAQATGGSLGPEKENEAAKALLKGFQYYLTALPLDTVVDAKGKPKTKYSKEIVKTIKERHDQLRNAAVMAWGGVKDFQNAYDCFQMYLDLTKNPILGANAPAAPTDTIIGEILWNQAIAMLLINNNEAALAKFEAMEPYGYIPAEYYDYAMGAAQALGDNETANAFARKGMAERGASTGFIAQLINTELDKENFEAAYQLGLDAINSLSPDQTEVRAQLYDILGTIEERAGKLDSARDNFKKSFETDPNYAKAYYDYARMLYNAAIELDDNLQTNEERTAQVNPKLQEASGYFEKAFELDKNQTNIPGLLYRLFYRLGNEEKANYWKNIEEEM